MTRTDIAQSIAVIAVAALLGVSLAKVEGDAESAWSYAIGGAIVAAVAVALVRWFARSRGTFSPDVPPRKWRGLKLGFGAFCIALAGWLTAVFLSPPIGIGLVALGGAFVTSGVRELIRRRPCWVDSSV